MNKIGIDTISSTLEFNLLEVDDEWINIIEPITLFKDAADRVLDAEGEKISIRLEDRKRLADHNIDADALRKLDKSVLRSLTTPINFVQIIIGPFIGEYGNTIARIRVPSWSTLGWQFKYLKKSEQTKEIAQERLTKEIEPSLPLATATCYSGIPLFVSGEGKNRGSFHHKYGFNQLVELRVAEYPDALNLKLQSVAFGSDFVALHYFQGRKKVTTLLPFPKLSTPLLKAYGVPCMSAPWFGLFFPWSTVLIDSEFKRRIRYREQLAIAFGFINLRQRFFIEKR